MNNLWNSLDVAGFDLPPQSNRGLSRILSAAVPQLVPESSSLYWTANFFGLDQVSLFRSASLAEQQEILARANRDLLLESCWIEQAGIGYMAKMVLLAESVEERMLYGLFTADETSHLAQIQQFCPAFSTAQPDAFLTFLSEVLTSSDKALLLFVLQVVLEGWGLSHYRSLARGCTDLRLRQVLQEFVQAESRHHATGVLSFQAQALAAQQSEMVAVLAQFLQMVRVGPQRLVAAIAEVRGDLSGAQRRQILRELDTETHSGTRLQRLKVLMQLGGGEQIVEILAAHGLFQPLTAEQCVNAAELLL